jgi:hypothetical protein
MGAGEENGVSTQWDGRRCGNPEKEDQSKDSERSSTAQVSFGRASAGGARRPLGGAGNRHRGRLGRRRVIAESLRWRACRPNWKGLAPEGVTEFTLPSRSV